MSRNKHIVTKRERERQRRNKAAAKSAKKEARRAEKIADEREPGADGTPSSPTPEPGAIVRPTDGAKKDVSE